MRWLCLGVCLVPSLAFAGGHGALAAGGSIYPTAKQARAAAPVTLVSGVAVTIVKEEGDVVRVSTAAGNDCLVPIAPAYEITGFVPRAQLIPRLAKPLVKSFADGSAIAADVGAPVISGTFEDEELAAGAPAISAKDTALAVSWSAGKLPATNAERVVCKKGIQTRAEFGQSDDENQRLEAEDEERRREQDRERRAKAATKKAAPKKEVDCSRKKGRAQQECEAQRMVDVLTEGDDDSTFMSSRGADEMMMDRIQGFEDAPACGLEDGSIMLNGAAIHDVNFGIASYRAGDKGFVDWRTTCGSVRVTGALSANLGGGGTGMGMFGGQTHFKAGPVFWPDGTRAGKAVADTWDSSPTSIKGMLCVDVQHVAEKVCHRADDVVK
ncbi:MAG TPA: hypothetical protein VGM39_01345 [Kofleriaceae bacterium]|jgi:hypothetical protein